MSAALRPVSGAGSDMFQARDSLLGGADIFLDC